MFNAFEQLKSLQPGAAHCFEEVVSSIFRATIPDAKRVRLHGGDGGVDTFTGTWASAGELDVYQMKYFVSQWGAAQKHQIRNAYTTAATNTDFNLCKWYLVVPSDLTSKDFKWFDEWKHQQKHDIHVFNGSDLSDRLSLPACAPARQMLRNWGVVGLGSEPVVSAWVRPVSTQRFPLVVNLWLENVGDRTLRSARIRIEHSETNTVAFEPDRQWWRQLSEGLLIPCNPWNLEAIRTINQGEKVPVLSIPFQNLPDGEVWIRSRITSEDIAPIETSCKFSPQHLDLQETHRFFFS